MKPSPENGVIRSFDELPHDHKFGQDKKRPGENRTAIVVAVTAAMMVFEITGGVLFGSMALLADGLHMASHAVALSVTLIAYRMARRFAGDPRLSFGTGKVNALAGFASAVLLAGFALIMVIESVGRLVEPVPIRFDQALIVAVIGLVVNGASALLLGHGHNHEHGPGDDHHHHHHHEHDHDHGHHHDHNLRAAYLHVLADALTSILAIFALLAGKYGNANFLDPAMGIVGAVLVGRWSYGLLKETGLVLLDRQAEQNVIENVAQHLAKAGATVLDLHVWSIGPGINAAAITVSANAETTAESLRATLPADAKIVHATIEVLADTRAKAPARLEERAREVTT